MNDLKYTLTRKEFADHLGISRDTLKKRIKRGHYKDQYVIQNGKYLFSGDTRDCPNKEIVPSVNKSLSPSKRVRNRGSHFESKNPKYNLAFKKHNELKMLAKLRGTTDPETLEVLPRALELAKSEKQQRIRNQLRDTTPKNYGGMLNRYNSKPLVDFSTGWKPLEVKPKDEYDKYLEDNDIKPTTNKTYY